MIIKSMARKKPSFNQLIKYMEKEDGERLIYHNFYGNDHLKSDEIIKIFEKNAQLLPKRKNGNYLYHEVLSLENNGNLQEKEIYNIAYELSNLYLEKRANKHLGFAVLHKNTDNIHVHFCISSNELKNPSRVRLPKSKFSAIQKNLENYVLEQYPDLNESKVYTKPKDKDQIKTSNKEQELKKRTKKQSRKEEIKTLLHGIFEQANTKEDLNNLLEKSGFRFYTRGQYIGLIDLQNNERRHRLKTLGLLSHYEVTQERLEEVKEAKEEKNYFKETSVLYEKEDKQIRAVEDLDNLRNQQAQGQNIEEKTAKKRDYQNIQPETKASIDLSKKSKEPEQHYQPPEAPIKNKALENLEAIRSGKPKKLEEPKEREYLANRYIKESRKVEEIPKKEPQQEVKNKEKSRPEKNNRLDDLNKITRNNKKNKEKDR